MNIHTWVEFSNHNSLPFSCSCASISSASSAATTVPSSHPHRIRLNHDGKRSQDPKHQAVETEDEDPTTVKDDYMTNDNDHQSLCHCRCSSNTNSDATEEDDPNKTWEVNDAGVFPDVN